MSLLEVDGHVARHGLLTAVHGISFSIAAGEVLAIVGANGAGKTTLFRTISGVHPLAGGTIRLGGSDISGFAPHRRVAAGIAMVPEGRRLFADMNVTENLAIAGENGRKGEWTLATVFDALPQLKPIARVAAGGLSGGQRQAVAIGRALMSNPSLLLLDEVSLGLSPIAVEGLYASLGALKSSGTTMIVVEQDLDRATGFADRIVCMLEGRAVLEDKSGALTRSEIAAAYFGLEAGERMH
ncbi:ABC transporter ATP-binding protein [Devosia sp. CN2-171]|uniref:ABC transporter ATP-binding protein n=1 Tax=Devosia sp. CN2-171 TaxID=3400909 RepID=UPI003BF7F325